MVINKTRFSSNAVWNKTLIARAKLIFGSDWEYDSGDVRVEASGQHLSLELGEKKISRHYAEAGHLVFWSGDKKGKCDPVPGVPAHMRIAKDGTVLRQLHCWDGVGNDPASGCPAFQIFYASGIRKRTEHHKNGKGENPNEYTPAAVLYYETGKIAETQNFFGGINKDSVLGLPARILYDKAGNISGGYSSVNGPLRKKATAALVAAAKCQLLCDLVGQDQVVALSAKSSIHQPGSADKLGLNR